MTSWPGSPRGPARPVPVNQAEGKRFAVVASGVVLAHAAEALRDDPGLKRLWPCSRCGSLIPWIWRPCGRPGTL
jgi:hypothetical protein